MVTQRKISNPNNKKIKARLIVIAALALAIFLLLSFAGHPRLVERYYSEGLYPFICRVLHPLFNLFPFSVGDIIYIAIVVYLAYAFISIIRSLLKREFKRAGIFLSGIVIGVQSGVLVFYLFWGLNYFRPSASERLNLHDSTYTTPELETVTAMLIDSANACRARVTPADLAQSNTSIFQIAVKAVQKLSADSTDFRTFRPLAKTIYINARVELYRYIGVL